MDTQPCPWIPDRWLSPLREYMRTLQIQIRYAAWTIPLSQIGDRYLMEDFLDQSFPQYKLEHLNACRMYLQVTTLSEITDHTGTELLPQVLSSRHSVTPVGLTAISSSTLQWPNVHLPSPACWKLWSTTISSIYTGDTRGTRLTTLLGAWLDTHTTIRFWHWRLANPTHLVFKQSPTSDTQVALQTQCSHRVMKFTPTIPTQLPFQGPPVTPRDPATGFVHLPIMPVQAAPTSVQEATMFSTFQQQFRATLLEWQLLLFGSLRKSYNMKRLHDRLCQKIPIMIVSDASVKKSGQSGFAWVIAEELTPLWRGLGLALGPEEDIYSGRAEAFGLLAAITFLTQYISTFDTPIPPTTVECFCDNLGVITTLTNMQENPTVRPNDTTANDHDIYLEITAAATRCHLLSIQYLYIPGHQDTKST